MSLFEAVFVRPWPFWAGGLAVGVFAVALAWVAGKSLGVSSGFGTLCSLVSGLPAFQKKPFSERWRLWFLLGIPLGGLAAAALSSKLTPATSLALVSGTKLPTLLVLFAGGCLVGYGARLTGG
jgi:hypothetical protein